MSTENNVIERTIGTHNFYFDAPDLIRARFAGDVSAADMKEIADFFKLPTGKFFLVLFTENLGSIPMAAKNYIANIPLASGMAVVGASRQAQFVLSMMNRIYMMVNLGKNSPMTFVSSEEEAMRWVEHLRRGPAA